MGQKKRTTAGRIGVDILGFTLIIAAGLSAPLPGPGGIPLLILGLSLLATNHAWAERILLYVKNHGLKFLDKVFDGSPRVKLLVDFTGIVAIVLGVLLIGQITHNGAKTSAISLIIVSIIMLLGNRKRAQSIKKIFSSKNR